MSESKGTPRNPRINYHFRRPEFDFMFQWAAGSQTNGGVEVGECFYAASQIKEGDEESWISAWEALGERVLKRGERRKTLIMIGGGDTFVEDLYAYIGPAGNKRGYNVLLVDLPGQGLLPFEGLTWRNESEFAVSLKHARRESPIPSESWWSCREKKARTATPSAPI